MIESNDELIEVGNVSGVYGVRGWVKIFSYTSPRENILKYSPWQLQSGKDLQEMLVLEGRNQGKGIVAHLEGVDDRDAAEGLVGKEIKVFRSQLPEAEEGEYYWMDLVGLRVVNQDGIEFGHVDHLVDTGANDVLVVQQGKSETLIPFIYDQVVKNIDLDEKVITVDWDLEY